MLDEYVHPTFVSGVVKRHPLYNSIINGWL